MITPSLFFAGAWLAALPVLLHLLMRQKPRRFEFPALRFLHKRHDANRRQLRLRHLLLLLLRMALIILAALALARPALHSTGAAWTSQKAPVAAILAFDTSKRMDYRHENHTRLEAAAPLANWLLGQLPPESEVAVLDGQTPGGALQVDTAAVRNRIERLETSPVARPVAQVVEEALRVAQTSRLERKEIYVFTDLARGGWPAGTGESLARQLKAAPEVGVQIIDVGVAKPVNDALGDLHLSAQALAVGGELRIDTELSTSGAAGPRTVELYVIPRSAAGGVSPAPQKREQRIVDVAPGQARQVDFRVTRLELGAHQGYVQLFGEDSLPIDNRRYFTVEVKPPWKVLLAAPQPLERHAVYLRNALDPPSLRQQGRSPYQSTVIPLDELITHNLDAYAAVFVLDPKPLEAALWRKLADYAADGHGVGVFLGRNADPIEPFNTGPAQELLAGKLLRIAQSPDEKLYLAPREYEHPALASFRGRSGQVPWFRHPVYRYWQLDAPPAGVQALVPYRDDEPAVLLRPVGKGRALTMTTPISDNPNRQPWNLLPVGEAWPFFILANGLASYLAGGDASYRNYAAGQSVALDLNPQWQFPAYVLASPDGAESRLNPDLEKHRLDIQGAQQPGNYRVRAGGTADGVDTGFSINLPAAVTRLDRATPDELAAFFGDPPRVARDREQIAVDISTGRVGRELYALIILVVAACLALEHFVANRFYKER